ncbi:hypothetical protein CDL12_12163 [Handroanthus impetiginosus]|uniref:ADP/ATP translocase n=1 Tax=Handroanthus impetiginosus TaxID=429701 RepID=A0A2G9HCG5_9LAMI|nr:hypothetical protein CDL12_12163 [Handroanthus impetiginosus]
MAYSFMSRCAKAIAEAPVVRVKFLLKNQGELIKSGRLSTPYKGITNCFARIIKNEGVFSLWRGNSAQFLQIIPSQVLDIVLTATFRNIVYNFKRDTDGKQNWPFGNSVARTAASAFTRVFTYPLDYAHTRLASDIKCIKAGGERQFNGLIDVWRKTLQADGV